MNEDAEVIDFYAEKNMAFQQQNSRKDDSKIETAKNWMCVNDLTIESAETYELLSRRAPFTFDMSKTKSIKSENSVCKLPVMFFWLRKPVTFLNHKNTGIIQSLFKIFLREPNEPVKNVFNWLNVCI